MAFLQKKPFPCNLRNGSTFILPSARSSNYSINSVQFRGSLFWNNRPGTVKVSVSVKELKKKKKKKKMNHIHKIHCSSVSCFCVMSVVAFSKLVFISLVTTA